jgi:cell division septation protein DedD
LLKKTDKDTLLKEDISAESFSLEESVTSEPEDHGKTETADTGISEPEDHMEPKEKLIIPKINLSETIQEFQKEESHPETENPKFEIRFKHIMPAEETVISQDTDTKAQSMESETGQQIIDQPKKPPEQVWQETELKSNDVPKSHKEKKKRSWIIPVSAIGAIIILAGAAWLVFPDQVKNILYPDRQSYEETMPEEVAMENSEITSVPDIPDEQLPAQEPIPDMNDNQASAQTETSVVQSEIQSSVKKYYVVAGCFKSQRNAEKYVAELQAKGYNSELFGTHDNLYAVSFNSFTSRESAVNEMNRIRKSSEPKAWILYY